MTYDTILKEFSLTEEHECWRHDFALSEPYVEEVQCWMVCDERVRARAAEVSLSAAMTEWLVEQTRSFAGRSAWVRLVAHLYYVGLVRAREVPPTKEMMPMLPLLTIPGGEVAHDLFYLHVYLSGVPRLQEMHKALGAPKRVTRDTLADFSTRMLAHREETGRWGMDSRMWMQHHFLGNLFTLGRLQFQFHRFPWPFTIYIHRGSGEVAALVQNGEILRADGHFANADGGAVVEGLWKAERATSSGEPGQPGEISGYGADGHKGVVVRERVVLDLSEWEEALAPGDAVLAIHIPASGPLQIEACVESLRQVEPFFAECFPAFSFKAATCATWLLDPQFEERLGSDANIVRFSHLFFSLPVQNASDKQLYERVFNNQTEPLDALPADNSMRRAVIAHMLDGKRWRTGSGVILRSQLPQ